MPPLAGGLWGTKAERGLPNPPGGSISPVSFRVLEQLVVGLAELGEKTAWVRGQSRPGRAPLRDASDPWMPDCASPGHSGAVKMQGELGQTKVWVFKALQLVGPRDRGRQTTAGASSEGRGKGQTVMLARNKHLC